MKACLPKDAAGNFIAEHEQSDVVHDLLAFLAVLKKNKKKLAVDSCPPGAIGSTASRVRGLGGQARALAGADQADR